MVATLPSGLGEYRIRAVRPMGQEPKRAPLPEAYAEQQQMTEISTGNTPTS